MSLSHGRQARVHPFILLLCCVPLFVVQVSAIFFLRTDLDVSGPVYDESDPWSTELLHLKILMIVVLYLLNFKMLLNSAQLMLFILNPITWVEIEHPDNRSWGFPDGKAWKILSKFSNMSFAWVALSMKFAVGYCVCIDSVSLILDSDSAQDVVFNSLAITFVCDLSTYWWEFCAQILHLDPIDDFNFMKMDDAAVWDDGLLSQRRAEEVLCPTLVNCVVRATRLRSGHRSILTIGNGARRVELVLAFCLLYYIYKRQLYIVLFAIDTNVLPVARDICTQWHLHMHDKTNLIRFFERMLVADVDKQLQLVHTQRLHGECSQPDSKFHRMGDREVSEIQDKYLHVNMTFSVILICLLVVPQVMHALHHLLLRPMKETLSLDEKQEDQIEALQRESQEHKEKLEIQQKAIDELRFELKQLRGSPTARRQPSFTG